MGHRIMGHRIMGHRIMGHRIMGHRIMGHLKHEEKKSRKRKKIEREKKIDKTSLDFLLEAKNVRISYLYETHQIEFIMLRSLCIWLHSQKFPYAKLKILLSLRLHIKFPATEKIIYSLLRIDTSCDREMKTELSGFKRGLATIWRFQGPVNIIFE